jgi:simple sugar transport system permease protein
MSPGYGYSGIVIAMLAGLNPLGVVAAAVFVAGVLVGADSMSRGVAVPTYIADVIVAVALISMLVATLFARYRLVFRSTASRVAPHPSPVTARGEREPSASEADEGS